MPGYAIPAHLFCPSVELVRATRRIVASCTSALLPVHVLAHVRVHGFWDTAVLMSLRAQAQSACTQVHCHAD